MRGEVVDDFLRWSERPRIPARRMIRWTGISHSKYYEGGQRYDKGEEPVNPIEMILCLPAMVLITLCPLAWSGEETEGSELLESIPEGYHLYACDDCGVQGRQPHVVMDDCYLWTFNTSDTDADLKSRSAVFSYSKINAGYDDLDPERSYVLALTYASDHVYKRVQSLWADGVRLHGPYALPNAKAVRVIVDVPRSVTEDGKMTLELKIHGEVNATASVIELWATGEPRSGSVKILSLTSLYPGLMGQVVDLVFNSVVDAEVQVLAAEHQELIATTRTDAEGWFSFTNPNRLDENQREDLRLRVVHEGHELIQDIPRGAGAFEPVRYRPIPRSVAGLTETTLSLDGRWRIAPEPAEDVRQQSLDSPAWNDFNVPGQWVQQGFDVPQDKPVAVAKEFTIPRQWAGHRLFLRFDSIHAGVRYWLNGKELGTSEALFTPIEWEITEFARPGEKNRLDLEMTVATASERLSFSSGYTFHNLGGIDRSVRLFALPPVNVKHLQVDVDLDEEYRDGAIRLGLTLENALEGTARDLVLRTMLLAPDGEKVKPAARNVPIDDLPPGEGKAEIVLHVPAPDKWTAETPNLYELIVELRNGDNVLERIERTIGFRKVEIKGTQMYLNGKRIKLAGACRHELDPLTGRADTMRHAERDIELTKGANLNYLRTAHYPPPMELVEAADRLGLYLEVEAPFCWVRPQDGLKDLEAILTPTSAMIDYYRSHPSVILWSLANESHFNKAFEISNALVKALDSTRPTTFNNPDPKQICDTLNRHYPTTPYHQLGRDDPRPLLLGEYFFPLCHEQTDVDINPGLRELWGHGHADPDSEWAKMCNRSFDTPHLKPGARPGTWSQMYHSDRIVGGAIWALLDEPFYLPGGKRAGYAWVHGFWGLLDGWRRPKPEYWMSKMIFSPVWFPVRGVDFSSGQRSITLPVENRYSFTDLSDLHFTWELGNSKGRLHVAVPPSSTGEMEIPVPEGAHPGDRILLRVTNREGELINVAPIALGPEERPPLPQPDGGIPKWEDDGKNICIRSQTFSLVLNRTTGDFDSTDPRHSAPLLHFPSLHLTRYDFGDLAGPNAEPYAVFPERETRRVEEVLVKEVEGALEVTVRESYEGFAGSVRWLLDARGLGKVTYDYVYSGQAMNTRELGVKFVLEPEYDELSWCRWSEWGVFPEDSICRTEGKAKALRTEKRKRDPDGIRPTWPWSQDQTELGTNDFRSVKFSIYDYSLGGDHGWGLRVLGRGDVHARSALSQEGVDMHVLSRCTLGQVVIQAGDKLHGECVVQFLCDRGTR